MDKNVQHRLDLRGVLIPFSLLKASQVFKIVKPGESMEIVCGDPDIKQDLFKILPHSSYELTLMEESEADCFYRIQLKKTQNNEAKP